MNTTKSSRQDVCNESTIVRSGYVRIEEQDDEQPLPPQFELAWMYYLEHLEHLNSLFY